MTGRAASDFRLRRLGPLVGRAHHRDHAAGFIGRGLECLGFPLHQGGLNVVALGLAVQDPAHGVTVMGKIGVQTNKTLAVRLVDAGNRIPGRWRRVAVEAAQVTLAAAFDDGVTHVDGDFLILTAAQLPDIGGGQPCCGDARLRGGRDAKRRRQLRLLASQSDGIERGHIAAGQCP